MLGWNSVFGFSKEPNTEVILEYKAKESKASNLNFWLKTVRKIDRRPKFRNSRVQIMFGAFGASSDLLYTCFHKNI